MKNLKFLSISLIAVALLISTNAFAVANFSGHWVANSGKLSSTIGLSADCKKVEIIIEQTETEIRTQSYNADCGSFGSKWGPIVQVIRDGKIFEQDEEVGTINDDTMITVSKSGSYQYAYNLRLHKDASGHETLESYYGTKGIIGAMVTEAMHEKVAP